MNLSFMPITQSQPNREIKLMKEITNFFFGSYFKNIVIDYIYLSGQVLFKYSASPEYQQIDIQALIVKQWQKRDQALFCPTAIQ